LPTEEEKAMQATIESARYARHGVLNSLWALGIAVLSFGVAVGALSLQLNSKN
jgi:hypothetical protein